jgi:microsomal dipeptidase-like Zn-dependent dipeptidase
MIGEDSGNPQAGLDARLIVNMAHSGWRTSLDAPRASQPPVVTSHSATAAVHRHIQSKAGGVIRPIAHSSACASSSGSLGIAQHRRHETNGHRACETAGLMQRGYPGRRHIEIIGGNVLRVIPALLPE